MKTNEDVLKIVFKKNEKIKYEINSKGIVTIFESQEHKIQKCLRKVGFKIPRNKKIELDLYSSYIFSQIDGKKSIENIGEILKEKFGEDINPLYERLLLFLNHIENNCNYIEKI